MEVLEKLSGSVESMSRERGSGRAGVGAGAR